MKAESSKEESSTAAQVDDLDSPAGAIRFLIDCTRVIRKFGGERRQSEAALWRSKLEDRLAELQEAGKGASL